jgi:tetratricopeptide (TPR) repeat protein
MKHRFVWNGKLIQSLFIAGLTLRMLNNICYATESEWNLHDNAWEHNRKGEWLLNRQDFAGAIEEFKAGLMMSQGTGREATFYNNIGMTLMNLGESTAAIDNFQMACRLSPSYSLYFLNLVRAYIQGQKQEALEKSLRWTVILNDNDAEAWFILGLLMRSESKPEEAVKCFQQYIKLQPASELAKAAKLLIKEQEPTPKPL